MENAVSYERNTSMLRVQYRSSLDGTGGIKLKTVFEAMEVSRTSGLFKCMHTFLCICIRL